MSDTITAPANSTIEPVAYDAGAAADWLIEQPVSTMKDLKIMKETAGMGQPESGKGLSTDWRGG